MPVTFKNTCTSRRYTQSKYIPYPVFSELEFLPSGTVRQTAKSSHQSQHLLHIRTQCTLKALEPHHPVLKCFLEFNYGKLSVMNEWMNEWIINIFINWILVLALLCEYFYAQHYLYKLNFTCGIIKFIRISYCSHPSMFVSAQATVDGHY